MQAPLVTCIMPTGRRLNRIPQALRMFFAQDYPNKELVVVDDGEESCERLFAGTGESVRYIRLHERVAVGTARNIACDAARGSVVAHFDDDDWQAPWRLSYQVALLQGNTRVTGVRNFVHLHSRTAELWRYRYFWHDAWVSGHSFAYLRSVWRERAFPDIQIGEDTRWVRALAPDTVLASPREDFVVGIIHDANTCRKKLESNVWSRVLAEEYMPAAMLSELPFYLDRMQHD